MSESAPDDDDKVCVLLLELREHAVYLCVPLSGTDPWGQLQCGDLAGFKREAEYACVVPTSGDLDASTHFMAMLSTAASITVGSVNLEARSLQSRASEVDPYTSRQGRRSQQNLVPRWLGKSMVTNKGELVPRGFGATSAQRNHVLTAPKGKHDDHFGQCNDRHLLPNRSFLVGSTPFGGTAGKAWHVLVGSCVGARRWCHEEQLINGMVLQKMCPKYWGTLPRPRHDPRGWERLW